MDLAPERFTKVATATLEAKSGEETIEFQATEARFVRRRRLSGASSSAVAGKVCIHGVAGICTG
jgi:hypothetical protein